MKRAYWHKIVAIFFAIYLPVITSGLALHKHYCKGQLEDVQWFFEPDSCEQNQQNPSGHSCCGLEKACHSDLSEPGEKKDCCTDEIELYKADLSLILQKNSNTFSKWINGYNFVFRALPVLATKSNLSFYKIIPDHFHPFPNGQSRLIAFQQFLC